MAENDRLDEAKVQEMSDAAQKMVGNLLEGDLAAAEKARQELVEAGKVTFGPLGDAIAKGTARLPGFCVFDGEGYDLELAKRSVGKGWHGILERLFAAKPPFVQVEQVKEKFAGLRIYTSSGGIRVDMMVPGQGVLSKEIAPEGGKFRGLNEEEAAQAEAFEELVQAAEAESYRTCERCGQPGHYRPHGWILTLCDACDIAWHEERNTGPDMPRGADCVPRKDEGEDGVA